MEEKLLAFIKNELINDPDVMLVPDSKLISSGLMDSFSLVTLQIFIEKEFGATVPAPKITADSFDSVALMIPIIQQFM
jgi:acyl carrier protein